jgi:O-antigen ligase
MMIWGLIILNRRMGSVQEVLRRNGPVLWVLAFMAVSVLWSNFPLVSLKRWVRAVGFLIMVLIILTEKDPWKAIDAVGRRLVYVAVPISILLIKYYPRIGVEFHRWQGYPMWLGITISKNDLGVLAAYGALFMVRAVSAQPFTKDRLSDKTFLLHLLMLLLCLHLLRGSGFAYSATSLVVLLCGFAVHFGLLIFKSAPVKFLRYASAAGAVVLLLLVVSPHLVVESTTQGVGRNESFTGRTEIWKAMFTEALKSPVLGTGYGAFYVGGGTYDWSEISGGVIGEGHNGYLDVFLELGSVGILLYLVLIVSAFRSVVGDLASNLAEGGLRLNLLVMVLVHNITESGLFSGLPSLWFVFLLAVMNRQGEPAPMEAPVPGQETGPGMIEKAETFNPAAKPV